MPVPSKRVKGGHRGTVGHHASLTHPDLQEFTIRWRGSFGCADAWVGEGDDSDERIPLCRIEYPGDEDRGFAVYDPATGSYTDAIPHTGHPTTPTTPPPSSTSPTIRSDGQTGQEPVRDFRGAALGG